jgi:hypothetical protein
MKTQPILLKLLTALALASALSVWASSPAQADATGMFGLARNSPTGMDVAQYRNRVGCFATLRPANEVMNYYRQMEYYTTQAFHSGAAITSTFRWAKTKTTGSSVQAGLQDYI